jgi:hypothetical protein
VIVAFVGMTITPLTGAKKQAYAAALCNGSLARA